MVNRWTADGQEHSCAMESVECPGVSGDKGNGTLRANMYAPRLEKSFNEKDGGDDGVNDQPGEDIVWEEDDGDPCCEHGAGMGVNRL